MALDVVKLYITLLSEFFVLSDMAVMTSSSSSATPPLFPTHSNSLTTAHYFMKIIGEIQETIGEIDTMDISSEAAGGVRNLLESTRWKFIDVLTHGWQRGLYMYLFREVLLSSSPKMPICSTSSKPGSLQSLSRIRRHICSRSKLSNGRLRRQHSR
jgi:exocyst complex component 2